MSTRTPTGKNAKAKAKPLAEYKRKRDFTRTKEPAGNSVGSRSKRALRFVIQKHAASHLHFDFRLELDGVMKSWAVPKGPSYDPAVKRLAMEVEDHPIEYNAFEGTIPKGQYGGGTVMLWDRGTYEPEAGGGNEALREGYERGDLKFVLHGKRLEGGWVLVRMRRGEGSRAQWLLIKHRDESADRDYDVTAEVTTSVATGRTMEEIATRSERVWNSNRDGEAKPGPARKRAATPKAKRLPMTTSRRKASARKSAGKKTTRKRVAAAKSAQRRG
jgi:bifunctional non-homologous end joining protein LigD